MPQHCKALFRRARAFANQQLWQDAERDASLAAAQEPAAKGLLDEVRQKLAEMALEEAQPPTKLPESEQERLLAAVRDAAAKALLAHRPLQQLLFGNGGDGDVHRQDDVPGGMGMAVEPTREWVEQLVQDRERLRQQLREAGLDPCA